MVTAIQDDMFTGEAIADPYSYYGKIRDTDPVYWNELYELWVITKHDDLVWMTRHHELFSSEFWKRDQRPPYPAIDESDQGLYQYMKEFFMDWFIQHDRPVHTDQRKVVHKWFNPKSMEMWRPMVQQVIRDMLDEADQNGKMDVMRDFATPLPLFIIAQMMGMPFTDRKFIREMAEKLLFIGRGESDRMQPLVDGIKELQDYLAPMVEMHMDLPVDEDNLLSVLSSGEKTGVLTRDEVVADAILLLLAGHETTINLICNGTLAFIQHPEQWQLLKEDSLELSQRGGAGDGGVPALRPAGEVHPEDSVGGRGVGREAAEGGRPHPVVHIQRQPRPGQASQPGCVRHHPLAQHPRRFRFRHPPLPGGDPGPAGSPGSLQGPCRAVRKDRLGDRRIRVPAQHHVPVVEDTAGIVVIGRQHGDQAPHNG